MRPVIAVIGSADPARSYDPPLKSPELACDAARELGKQLADQSCRIVVYSSAEGFIEREVAAGYVESAKAAARSVEIRGRSLQAHDFPGMRLHPDLFWIVPEVAGDWEVGYYRSLHTVDGILLLGGGRSTFIAGLIGLSRGVAVAPLSGFGGAGQKVWERLSSDRDLATNGDIATLGKPWQPGDGAVVVASLVAQLERRQAAVTKERRAEQAIQRRRTISLIVALGLLLLGLATIPPVYSLATGTWMSLSLLVVAPVLTSISGAIIRNALDDTGQWVRAAVVGAGAGTVAFLLFVAAQIATNPAMLTADSARRLVFFVLAVGFVGGFTSEAVYAKLRAEDVIQTSPLQPPTGGGA
jgi:hypothetical protein